MSRQNTRETAKAAIFVHTRFAEPDGPKFEDAIAKLRKRPEPALRNPDLCERWL